tara:strand:+ start:68 stop:322 length:255 start_codon:yes stop_codon:yes gene_type:complete
VGAPTFISPLEKFMQYLGCRFSITNEGLKLDDKGEPELWRHQVQLHSTPLEVGDVFTLELDEEGRMFFKKTGPIQTELNFNAKR